MKELPFLDEYPPLRGCKICKGFMPAIGNYNPNPQMGADPYMKMCKKCERKNPVEFKCNKCFKKKAVGDFGLHKGNVNKLDQTCKACRGGTL